LAKYLSTSLIFKSSHDLYNYFLTSQTFKVLCVLLNWCSNSKINQLISKYLQRSSHFKYSKTYKVCSKVFSSIDRLWDKLFNAAVICGRSSIVIAFIKRTFCSNSSFITLSVFVLFFSCGYGATSILSGTFSNTKAILVLSGFLIANLLLVEKSRWSACLRGSLFLRIILYIFD
jgi:hypothetical protein